LRHTDGADGISSLDNAFALDRIQRIHPEQAIVAVADQLPALRGAAVPNAPTAAILVAIDPPVSDIDIAIAGLTPDGSGLRKIHPERPVLVIGKQRVAGQDTHHVFGAQHRRACFRLGRHRIFDAVEAQVGEPEAQ